MSTMRITGMASGLDTQKMVDDMMNVQRARYITPLDRSKQLNVWKREAFQSYTKDIADFMVDTRESLGYTYLGQIGALLNKDVNTYDWAKLATTSNTSIATATATAEAVDGNLSFRIDKLAEGVTMYSKEQLKIGDEVASSDKLIKEVFPGATYTDDPEVDADGNPVLDGDGNPIINKVITFDINGKSFKFKDTDSIDQMTKKINDTKDLGAKLHFVDGRFTFSTDGTGASKEIFVTNDSANFFNGPSSLTNLDLIDNKLTKLDGGGDVVNREETDLISEFYSPVGTNYALKINDVDITVPAGGTIEDLVNAVNSSSAGVELRFDGGRFTIESNPPGGDVKIEGADSALFVGAGSATGLDLETVSQGFTGYKGKDAEGTVIGADIKITSSTNDLMFNGIKIKAKSTGTINISTEPNVDGIVEKIRAFVDGYNSIIEKMNGAVTQKKDRDYYPLTDEERGDLSEEQAAKWDERAKAGLLQRDTTLSTITTRMRQHLYQPVYENYGDDGDVSKAKISMLTEIGISTGKYTDKGKLVIDENKLRDAIKDDTEGVLTLLFKPPGDNVNLDDSAIGRIEDNDERVKTMDEKYSEMGVFNRIMSDLTSGVKQMVDKAGAGEHADTLRDIKSNIMVDFITKKGGPIADIDKTVEELVLEKYYEEKRLTDYESGLWRKFSVLEKTMQELNSKTQWLQSQLGSM